MGLKLPEPTNFAKLRQQEMDMALVTAITTADSIPYLSKRYILVKYGQWTEEELVQNEHMLRQEKGFDKSSPDKDLPDLYRADDQTLSMGGGAGGGGGGGAPAGGLDIGEPGAPEGGPQGTEPVPGAPGATPGQPLETQQKPQ